MLKEKNKVIPMTYDVVFKSVLQDKESEGYLIDLINGITGIKKEYLKGNIVFKNAELKKDEKNEKKKATDLIIEVKENIINLEMNKNYYNGLFEKNDRYIDKIKDGLVSKGDKYIKQKKLIQINFDDFERFDERIVIKFRMMDKERGLIRSDYVYNTDVEIYHINLKRINKMYYNNNKLNKFEKELLLMTLDDEEELTKTSKGCKEMEKVAEKISRVSREEELQGIYDVEEQEKFIRDRIRAHAATEGFEQGIEKGVEQGIKQGIEQGIERGKRTKQIEIAKNLLASGVSIDIIEQSTGLKHDEITNEIDNN